MRWRPTLARFEHWLLAIFVVSTATGGAIIVAHSSPSSATVPVSAPASSSLSDEAVALPDPGFTPGAVLTTDAGTVCVSGYTKSVRVFLTVAERDQVDAHYRWTYAPGAQEYDHLIPLELGGGNGMRDIWPQPIAEARIKDRLENALHAKVCAHQMLLQNAQTCIRSDWYQCWQQEGKP